MRRLSVGRVWATFVVLIRDNLSSRLSIFFIVFFPVMLTAIFTLVGYSIINSTIPTVYVVNNAGEAGHNLIEDLANTGLVRIVAVNSTASVPMGSTYMIIPPGFPESHVTIYYSDDFIGQRIFLLLKSLVNSYNSENLVDGYALRYSLNPFVELIVGVIGITVSSNALFGLTGVTIGYERDKVLLRIAASPLRNIEWILAMTMYQFVIAAISVGVVMITALVIGFVPRLNPLFLVPFVEALLLFGGLGGVIIGITPRGRIFLANIASNVIFFPLMFFSNVIIPSSTLPSPLNYIVEYNPLSIINNSMKYLLLLNNLSLGLYYSLILLPFSVALMILGAKLMRIRET